MSNQLLRLRNRASLLRFSATLVLLLATSSTTMADRFNPAPATGDLILPMPGGASMVFRPVFLDVGDSPFAAREFKIGDRTEGGFKEYPTTVVLGGSFRGVRNGRSDWLFYMGKYEVMKSQFNRVMDAENVPDNALPAVNISWFEVQQFMNKYNTWLFKNARDSLPRNSQASGFLRLPTEMEWEYAARGGCEVDQDTFDRKHPYGTNLSRYEWFEGPSSSYGKINETGLLQPNALMLHDMLGNVQEITANLYRIEYYQGRPGGFVSRGGFFLTRERKIRASLRHELRFYGEDGNATKMPVLGFRMVISSPIYTRNESPRKLAEAWEEYRAARPIPMPASVTSGSRAARTGRTLEDAIGTLARLEAAIGKLPSASPEVHNQIGLLKASFGDVESLINRAEQESGAAWARMAGFTGYVLHKEILKERTYRDTIKQNPDLKQIMQSKYQNIIKNIEDAAARYSVIITELGKIEQGPVRKGFASYQEHLQTLGLTEQMKINKVVESHYFDYAGTQRLNLQQWKADLGQQR